MTWNPNEGNEFLSHQQKSKWKQDHIYLTPLEQTTPQKLIKTKPRKRTTGDSRKENRKIQRLLLSWHTKLLQSRRRKGVWWVQSPRHPRRTLRSWSQTCKRTRHDSKPVEALLLKMTNTPEFPQSLLYSPSLSLSHSQTVFFSVSLQVD